jgi:hypothetical protein
MKAIITAVILALVVTATAAAMPDPMADTGYDAREISRAASPEAAEAAGVGLIDGGSNNQRAPDFWNYDPQTGERIANTSPGIASEDLAAIYGVPTFVVHDGGFAWDNAAEGAAVGFGFAMILAALALLIARSRRAVPAV